MKNYKIRLFSIISICISMIFFMIIVSGIISSHKTANANADADADTYTVYDEDDYYSETTYYLKEEAYKNHLQEASENLQLYSNQLAVNTSVYNALNNTAEEFVIAATKGVWVSATADENGNIIEERLLKKAEVENIQSINSIQTNNNAQSEINLISNNQVGSDKETMYYLEIKMTVYYNTLTGQYLVESNASWAAVLVWAWDTDKAAEEFYKDYIGITWGGAGTLQATNQTITGTYYNGKAVTFSRMISDSYAGYVWQFNEKSGYLGKEMKNATANISLKKQGSNMGKKTNVKMTYIHTYGKINGSLTLGINSNGEAAASLTLSETTKQWQIEIDVPNLDY